MVLLVFAIMNIGLTYQLEWVVHMSFVLAVPVLFLGACILIGVPIYVQPNH